MVTRTLLTFTLNIPIDTHVYHAELPRIGVIERIILRTDATAPKRVTLVLNGTHTPIDLSWEALRLLRVHTTWRHEPHARLLYEDGDFLDLKLNTAHYTRLAVQFHDASGLQEITVVYTTTNKL